MKGFFKFIGYFFAAYIICMGLVYLYSIWFANKVTDVAENITQDIEEIYTTTTEEDLELVGDVTMTSSGSYGYYTYTIEGVLKNVSGKEINYAQVSFVIYDMAGNNIGSAFDNVSYIDVNGTWKFKATYFGKETNIKYSTEPKITSW